MKFYTVTLTLSIEAINEQEAILQFYKIANECAFDRDSLEIEEE